MFLFRSCSEAKSISSNRRRPLKLISRIVRLAGARGKISPMTSDDALREVRFVDHANVYRMHLHTDDTLRGNIAEQTSLYLFLKTESEARREENSILVRHLGRYHFSKILSFLEKLTNHAA